MLCNNTTILYIHLKTETENSANRSVLANRNRNYQYLETETENSEILQPVISYQALTKITYHSPPPQMVHF